MLMCWQRNRRPYTYTIPNDSPSLNWGIVFRQKTLIDDYISPLSISLLIDL